MDISFRPAVAADEPAIRALLQEAGLPVEDLSLKRQDLLLAVQGEQVVGCAALERHGADALIRSYAVAPALRRHGLGSALHERILAHAAACKVDTAWLLTTTAAPFFAARGFEQVDRRAAPRSVAASPEFKTLCPASAVCMRRSLAR
ncbi:MAG: arsenic resistance N-acetyltransferase ArsN2 [Anaeromyxobacter sp.]